MFGMVIYLIWSFVNDASIAVVRYIFAFFAGFTGAVCTIFQFVTNKLGFAAQIENFQAHISLLHSTIVKSVGRRDLNGKCSNCNHLLSCGKYVEFFMCPVPTYQYHILEFRLVHFRITVIWNFYIYRNADTGHAFNILLNKIPLIHEYGAIPLLHSFEIERSIWEWIRIETKWKSWTEEMSGMEVERGKWNKFAETFFLLWFHCRR